MNVIKPLYTKVVEHIMEKIQSGEWSVGHMLPTEIELCEQFGLSRPSIRNAMLMLVNEGYLIRVKGKGTFVTTPRRVEESTLFIESFAAETLRQGRNVVSEVLEFRIMRAEDRIRQFLQLSEGEIVIKLSRLRYSQDSTGKGPIVLTSSYFSKRLSFLQDYDFSLCSVHQALAEHNIARKYIEKHINVTTLDSRSARLIGIEPDSLALLVTSITRDGDNNLIEYSESLYPASRNEFILKIRM